MKERATFHRQSRDEQRNVRAFSAPQKKKARLTKTIQKARLRQKLKKQPARAQELKLKALKMKMKRSLARMKAAQVKAVNRQAKTIQRAVSLWNPARLFYLAALLKRLCFCLSERLCFCLPRCSRTLLCAPTLLCARLLRALMMTLNISIWFSDS